MRKGVGEEGVIREKEMEKETLQEEKGISFLHFADCPF